MSPITIDPQIDFLQCSNKALTTSEITKLRGGVGVLSETWINSEGHEWLVWKIVPRDRTKHYTEGISRVSDIATYKDIEVYKVYNISGSRSNPTPQKINGANNNPQHYVPPSFQKRPDLDQPRVRKRVVGLNSLVVVSAQKIIRDHLKRLHLKRKEPDVDTSLSLESLNLSSRPKKARIIY